MYYVYLVQCEDKSIYTGITTDVVRRFQEHKNKKVGARYTKMHKVEKIVHTEQFKNRSDALKREAQIKSWPREKKLKLINE